MNALDIARKGKGFTGMLKRAGTIGGRYGLTGGKMNGLLGRFGQTLAVHHCGATFPITAAALARSRTDFTVYTRKNVEFAVHGYYHVDYSSLPLEEQLRHLVRARQIFRQHGLDPHGFRAPYLRWNQDTLTAVREAGFLYDSSQSIAWDVIEGVRPEAYERVLDFYRAVPASVYPSLPRLEAGLVRVPYCLPDDEGLVERLRLHPGDRMNELWLRVLAETYRLGELFTVGLHPERIALCEGPLAAVLGWARGSGDIWMAGIDEIVRWWQERLASTVTVDADGAGRLCLEVSGPPGVTILARGVDLHQPTKAWGAAYRRVDGLQASWSSARRPFIAVSPRSDPAMTGFLRQQGYIVEGGADPPRAAPDCYGLYLDWPHFAPEDERPLLAQIEHGDFPLVRLSRWPDGARSALCVTGDIDALTLWDYGLRLLER